MRKTQSGVWNRPTRRQLLQAAAATAVAAPAPSSASPSESSLSIRLAKNWEYHRGSLGGIWEVWRGNAATSNVSWEPVEIPHCFNARDAVDPDGEYYEGPGWYRTTLPSRNPYPKGRTLLHFDGAGQRSEIFLGLESAGGHLGGYDEFTIDITEALARQPEGRLAVLCDNSRDLETIPSDLSDFNRYGGLYRHVTLAHVPAISAGRLWIEPRVLRNEANLTVKLRLYNPGGQTEPANCRLRIEDPDGAPAAVLEKRLTPAEGWLTIAEIPVANPALWSPEAPNLYRCRLSIESVHGAHSIEERFGFRWFEFPEFGVFSLNGRKLFLRGTQRHEDHAGAGAAMSDDLTARELNLVKAMGANFLRLGHYQQSRRVLELCDELGLIVWEEIPWCRGGIGGAGYREQARGMLRNMIEQHRNHPSVIFWGLGNENDWPGDFKAFDQQAVRVFLEELNRIAHDQDPSRLTAIRRCPFAAGIPDVYSPSIWAGWYSGRYTEYKDAASKEVREVRRMLHMEWGGDSHAGRHSEDPDRVLARIATGQGVEEKERAFLLTGGQARASRDGDWSESYICNLYDWYLKEQETMDWLAGSAQWVFKDFSTPLRPENPIPRVNQKGVVERDLTPKEGYYVFQSYWSQAPMVHIPGHSWPVRWGTAGELKLVKVYSNCPQAELFLNGTSLGVKRRNSQDFPAAGLRWLAVFREDENHLRVVARKDGREVTDEIRFLYQSRAWGKPAQWRWRELGRRRDVVGLEVQLLDAAGVPCLDARHAVRFQVAGDGELIQNMGTARGSRKVELANGRAVAHVRLTGGAAVLSVSAEGVPTVFRTIGG